jgi:biopolymer transport protein ExbD
MRLKRKEKPAPQPDLSAFSDLAFLLIIFFILTTTLEQFTGTKLDIPAGVEKEDQAKREQLTINLALDAIHYGKEGARMDLPQLRAALAAERFAAREPNERVVLVETRDDVPFDLYYKVVTAIADAGGVMGLVKRGGGG